MMKIEEKRAEKKKYGMLNIYLFNYENCLRYMKSEKFMQSQFFGIQVMCKNILFVFISLFKLVGEKTLRKKKLHQTFHSIKLHKSHFGKLLDQKRNKCRFFCYFFLYS